MSISYGWDTDKNRNVSGRVEVWARSAEHGTGDEVLAAAPRDWWTSPTYLFTIRTHVDALKGKLLIDGRKDDLENFGAAAETLEIVDGGRHCEWESAVMGEEPVAQGTDPRRPPIQSRERGMNDGEDWLTHSR